MVYEGEVLIVKAFIRDMTGTDLRSEVVREALKRAAEYRQREDQYEARGHNI